MDFDEMYPGRFLKSTKLKNKAGKLIDVTLTIENVFAEELEGDKGKKLTGILSFVGKTLQLTLNKTNGLCLKAMFGRETNDWIGKRVTLWAAPYHDNTTGEDTTCIRVRGSPDISADKTFELKLARKKPVMLTMRRTATKAAAAAPSPPPPPAPDPAPAPIASSAPFEPPSPDEIVAAEAGQVDEQMAD